jgi:AcrR family transcriptional regulator
VSTEAHLDHAEPTREKILATATRMFAEHGYDHTSLALVAREAQVSKALILWHFDSKDRLFEAALHRALEPYFINVSEIEGLDELGQVERLIDLFYEFVRDNAGSVRFFLSLIVNGGRERDQAVARVGELYRLFRNLLTEAIDRGRQRGRFLPNVEPALEAGLIVAALAGLLVGQFLTAGLQDEAPPLVTHLKRTTGARLTGRAGS